MEYVGYIRIPHSSFRKYARYGNDARDDAATSSSLLGGICCEGPASGFAEGVEIIWYCCTYQITYESAPPRLFDKFKWSTYLPRTKRKSSFEIHSPKQSQEMRHKKRRLHRAIIETTTRNLRGD